MHLSNTNTIDLLQGDASDLGPLQGDASDLGPLQGDASDLGPLQAGTSDLEPLQAGASDLTDISIDLWELVLPQKLPEDYWHKSGTDENKKRLLRAFLEYGHKYWLSTFGDTKKNTPLTRKIMMLLLFVGWSAVDTGVMKQQDLIKWMSGFESSPIHTKSSLLPGLTMSWQDGEMILYINTEEMKVEEKSSSGRGVAYKTCMGLQLHELLDPTWNVGSYMKDPWRVYTRCFTARGAGVLWENVPMGVRSAGIKGQEGKWQLVLANSNLTPVACCNMRGLRSTIKSKLKRKSCGVQQPNEKQQRVTARRESVATTRGSLLSILFSGGGLPASPTGNISVAADNQSGRGPGQFV